MSHDDYMVDILKLYQQTAEKLYKNEPVSGEEMRRYHGITGMMVARVAAALWSKEELEENIDARLKAKCDACKATLAMTAAPVALVQQDPWYTQVIVLLTPWRWAIAVACFSPVLPTLVDKVSALIGK